jgi:recombination protein RecA
MMAKAKTPSLESVLSDLRGEDLRIGRLAEVVKPVEFISTGNVAIDHILGGGLPKGRVVELYGREQSGKSTLALQVAAEAQRQGLTVLYLDFEAAIDDAYCRALGIDPDADTFVFFQPDTLEEGVNVMRKLLKSGLVHVTIVDSVAMMVSQKEVDAETGATASLADKAKVMHQVMRQITPDVKRHGVVSIWVNHLREKIDTSPVGRRLAGQLVTTPGGGALHYQASVRVEFRIKQRNKQEIADPIGGDKRRMATSNEVTVKVVKNKVAPPGREAEVRLIYGRGFSQAYSVLNVLVAAGVIKKGTGGVYTFEDGTTTRGLDNTLEKMTQSVALMSTLIAQALKVLREEPSLVLSEEEPDTRSVSEAVDEMLGRD